MGTFFSAVIFIIVFGSILFLAYATTKYIGTKTSNTMKGRYINVLETVQLGLDGKLHLVKVGDEFVLISSSGKNIQMLKTLEIDGYSSEETNKAAGVFDFKEVFEKYISGFKVIQNKTSYGKSKANETQNGNNSSVFKNNLTKLKKINAGASGLKSDFGDGNSNEN
ncbi:MAG: flagellar biosynthetic protein FliO [Clostridiaceae bacterium]|nr:flagellar biosynthetic protein FliO [Clostridiaceae bacterium]